MDFRIGDLVTRISHHHDILFKVVGIENRIVYLKGVDLRLVADSDVDDLVKAKVDDSNEDKTIIEQNIRSINLDRSEYFYLPGKVLHIDGDIYLNNNALNPYKIRENEKINNDKNNIKKKKIGNFS